MTASSEAEVGRIARIRKGRSAQTLGALFTTTASGQLMFASFAFGASRGPGPLASTEIGLGTLTAFLAALIFAVPLKRRRHERDADRVVRMIEGRRRRRLVLFEDYLTLDNEIVLKSSVESVSENRETQSLVIRYRDHRYSGPVLRELKPPDPEMLPQLVEILSP